MINPDERRSTARWTTKEVGKKLRIFLEVPELGVITMIVASEPKTGKLVYEGIGLIMQSELMSGELPSGQ